MPGTCACRHGGHDTLDAEHEAPPVVAQRLQSGAAAASLAILMKDKMWWELSVKPLLLCRGH